MCDRSVGSSERAESVERLRGVIRIRGEGKKKSKKNEKSDRRTAAAVAPIPAWPLVPSPRHAAKIDRMVKRTAEKVLKAD